jgi:hypothetical protein
MRCARWSGRDGVAAVVAIGDAFGVWLNNANWQPVGGARIVLNPAEHIGRVESVSGRSQGSRARVGGEVEGLATVEVSSRLNVVNGQDLARAHTAALQPHKRGGTLLGSGQSPTTQFTSRGNDQSGHRHMAFAIIY